MNTSQFLETTKADPKRNGGLLVASQNFREFTDSLQGRAVLSNAAANIFLKQDSSDIDAVQDTFKLSDGESDFLYSANRGEFLLRVEGESTVGYAKAFDFERELIERSYTERLMPIRGLFMESPRRKIILLLLVLIIPYPH